MGGILSISALGLSVVLKMEEREIAINTIKSKIKKN